MPEYKLGDVDFVGFVDLGGDTFAVVEDGDEALLFVDVDFDAGHVSAVAEVVGGVDDEFVEDLVEAGDVGDFSFAKFGVCAVEEVERLVALFDGA